LAFGEKFLCFQDFGALQVTNFGRQSLARGGNHSERRKIHRMPVARDDLRRDRLNREAHFFRDISFHARIDLGERADRAGDGSGRHFDARRF
jgi:hypothetical protein